MKYVLILFAQWGQFITIPFESEQSCKMAAMDIQSTWSSDFDKKFLCIRTDVKEGEPL